MLSSAPPAGFRRLSVVTAVGALILVAVGGAVRATDSGLACPTWPGCFSAGDFLPPVGLNVWLEHSHRLIAGVVGLLIAAMAVWSLLRFRDRPRILWPTLLAAVLVVVQALLGALVVRELLRADLVTAHLGMAMIVVACVLAVAVNAAQPRQDARAVDGRFRRMTVAVAGLAFVQILVGGHVTGTASGLVYSSDSSPLWGALGIAPISSAHHAYNLGHRVLALVLAGAVMALVVIARRTGQSGWTLQLPRVAAWLVVVQIVVGVANLASGLSFVTVIPHLAVASWIWAAVVLTGLLAHRPAAAPAEAEAHAQTVSAA